MQISKLYETKITCSNYNPNIDDTITVTVALIDFNGNNVTGTNATITVNQGYFTKYTRNSSDTAISGTTTKTYTGTTGTDGTFTMTYNCSEWGLATFSANNTKIQSEVTGWKQISTNTTNDITSVQYCNGEYGYIQVSGTPNADTSQNDKTLMTLTQYLPKYTVRFPIHPNGQIVASIYGADSPDGMDTVKMQNHSSTKRPGLLGSGLYRVK